MRIITADRRPNRSLAAPACTVVVVAFAVAVVLAALRGPVGAQEQSACSVTPDKVAAPSEIELGETVRVTLTLTSSCPPEQAPVDVVLVLDQSASMGNKAKLDNAKAAAVAFVEAMDLGQSRVGLVAFNQDAGLRVPLTQDGEKVTRAINDLFPGGQTNISGAIGVAHAELMRDVQGHALAMIVLTDGFNTVPGALPVPEAAAAPKADGVTIATFCAGGECDPGLQPAASGPAFYFNVDDTARLADLYRELAGTLQANALVTITVRDEIPANMRYLPGTARPVPDEVGADFLAWRLAGALPEGGLSYDLRPLAVGLHPTNVVAVGQFTDRRGLAGDTVFPVPVVRVTAPECMPRPLEIYFLIDDSNCLSGASLGGEPANIAIRKGVERVLDQVDLGRDIAAVIGFGDQAITFQTLTADRASIVAAAEMIGFRDETARLDRAYQAVADEMASARHDPSAQVVTIVVTDGPMSPALPLASAQADALRRRGVKHYAIGIGTLAQHALLRAIAEPGGYRELRFGGDVITAYREIGTIVAALADVCGRPSPTPTPAPSRWLYLPRALQGGP